MVAQGHPFIFRPVFDHAWVLLVERFELILHTHVLFELSLKLPELSSGRVLLNFDLGEKTSDLLVLIVSEHEPVGLASRARVMQLNRCFAYFLICK